MEDGTARGVAGAGPGDGGREVDVAGMVSETPAMTTEDTQARFAHTRFEEKVQEAAGLLRRMADTIEREGKTKPDGPYTPGHLRHVDAAQRTIHEVTWGMANLNLGSLLTWAAEADTAERGAAKVSGTE